MTQIEARHYELIKKILLSESNQEFFVFGSRAKNTASKFSDLDLAYKQEIPRATLTRIKTKLAESSLPFTVDLVYLDSVEDSFNSLISKDLKKF
jgi:predicted nucleotidyltransferase